MQVYEPLDPLVSGQYINTMHNMLQHTARKREPHIEGDYSL